jgi:tetratricopeptide (TPR) repeat protein
MNTLAEFQQLYSSIVSQETISEAEIQKIFTELDSFIYSANYEQLNLNEKEQIQELLASVRNLLSVNKDQESGSQKDIRQGILHDMVAEKLMDEAEEHFYAGRYAKAIDFYRKILEIEPTWIRAISHYEQAREYLKTGEIPTVALPLEAAILFGKAQSAARVMRYHDALELVQQAKLQVKQAGIPLWKAGNDLEDLLSKQADAQDEYSTGIKLFKQGQIQEAIAKTELAMSIERNPLYEKNLEEYFSFLNVVNKIQDTLVSPSNESAALEESLESLGKLEVKYPDHPSLETLRIKIESQLQNKQVVTYKENVKFLVERLDFTNAIESAKKAINLDASDSMLRDLTDEISLIIEIQREIIFLESTDACDSSLYNNILDKIYAIKHPWLLDTRIAEKIKSEIASLRSQKSNYFEKQGKEQLEHAKEALYLSVMSELSGKAVINFEKALNCDPQKIDLSSLISEAKAVKDKVDSILNGDEKSFLDYVQSANERQKTIAEITRRMETVIVEFDKGSEEYKTLWQQLESLFDKRTKSLNASEDRVAVVLAKVDAEIKNIQDRRPWSTTLVIAILLIIVSGVLLALNPKRTMVPFPADFPADLVLYASLFGSTIRVVVELFDRSRTKWVDTVRLTILRPLIGMGVTVLIVLFVYAGLGTILAFNPAMGFWGYVSLSSIIGYSDSIMNKIITILEKGISIKV